MSALLAISFLVASSPRFAMIARLRKRRRPPTDRNDMVEWFWVSNAGVMIGVVISVVILVSILLSR